MALAPEQVGARIAKARKAKGWTHERLAREMGVGLRTAQRWQKGRNPKNGKPWLPGLTRLMDLADKLDVPRSYFVETDDYEPPSMDGALDARVADLEAEVRRLREQMRGDAGAVGGQDG